MSERVRRSAALVVALLAPLTARAQSPAAALRAAEARVARVQARYDAALDSLAAERSQAIRIIPSREITLAGIAVRVPVEVTDQEGAAAEADLAPMLAPLRPVSSLVRGLGVLWTRAPGHPWTKVTVAVEGDTIELEVGDVDARTRIVWGITEGVRRALGRALDPALLDWAGGVPIPRGSLTLPELRAARRALALSPSSVAHECLRGDAAACGAILDVDGPAASLDRWYLAADLPLLARSSEGLRARSTAWQRCAWAGDAALCHSLLVDLPRAGLPLAIPRTSRDDLLRFALARGGDEALPRLIAARGRPIADQLAAAAGSSWPELRSAWASAVSGGSGQRDPATFFLASGWTVALLGASAWRFRRRAA